MAEKKREQHVFNFFPREIALYIYIKSTDQTDQTDLFILLANIYPVSQTIITYSPNKRNEFTIKYIIDHANRFTFLNCTKNISSETLLITWVIYE